MPEFSFVDVKKVLLRRDAEAAYELGLIIDQRGQKLSLRDSAGVVTETTKGPKDVVANLGTVMHLLWVAPEQIELALAERPELLFKQLLLESGRRQQPKDLKAKLKRWDYLLDAAWERAKQTLAADPTVQVPGDDGDGYMYTADGSNVPGFLDLFPAASFATASDMSDNSTRLEPDTRPSTPPASARTRAVRSPTVATVPATHHPSSTASEAKAKPTKHSVVADERESVASYLQAVGDPAVAELARIVDIPLRAGRSFQRLPGKEQTSLIGELSEPERRLVALIGGRGKAGQLDVVIEQLRLEDFHPVLEVAIRELAQTSKPTSLAAALVDLVQRACLVGPLPTDLLLRVCSVVSRSDRKATPEVLHLVAERLRSSSLEELEGWDLDLLARTMVVASFGRGGGRTATLAALYRVAPVEARKDRWWSGADLGGLAGAARGGLAQALEDGEISATVVAPLVQRHVATVSSRSGMATVWNLPAPLAKHVTGEDFARLFRSVGTADPLVAAWRAVVVNEESQAQRDRELKTAQAVADEAERARDAAESRVARIETDLARTVEQLNQARSQGVEARQQHDRQSKIDAVRALAMLAAQVLQSDGARSDEALVRAVRHTCAREGLTPLGDVGEPTSFDPALHDSMGRAVSEGSAVCVVRSGYTWASGAEEVVLLKPQVVLQGD